MARWQDTVKEKRGPYPDAPDDDDFQLFLRRQAADPQLPARLWPLISGDDGPIAERMIWDDWYLSIWQRAADAWGQVKQHTTGKQVA